MKFAKLVCVVAVLAFIPSAFAAHFTQAEVAEIVTTANNAEIESSQLALLRSQDSQVREFAQMMIDHHTQSNVEVLELTAIMQSAPEENETSARMAADAGSRLAALNVLDGEAFDRAYMDNQVMMHQKALDLLDRELIPSAQSAEFTDFLTRTRATVAQHLERATAIQTSLADSAESATEQ